jgi:ActR/RegA family two-component response regulator
LVFEKGRLYLRKDEDEQLYLILAGYKEYAEAVKAAPRGRKNIFPKAL